MIDEKFMNEVIETLNMRACEEVEQYAGQAIDTVDTGVFLALEKWLRLKEDFLSADISPLVIEPISPNGENGQCAEKLLFAEREAWEAKQRESLELMRHVQAIFQDIKRLTAKREPLFSDCLRGIEKINKLRDLLANKDEVQK